MCFRGQVGKNKVHGNETVDEKKDKHGTGPNYKTQKLYVHYQSKSWTHASVFLLHSI